MTRSPSKGDLGLPISTSYDLSAWAYGIVQSSKFSWFFEFLSVTELLVRIREVVDFAIRFLSELEVFILKPIESVGPGWTSEPARFLGVLLQPVVFGPGLERAPPRWLFFRSF